MTDETNIEVQDEAPKAPRARKAKKAVEEVVASAKRDMVLFESYSAEQTPFKIMGIRPIRSKSDRTRLIWQVTPDLAERFARHHFVSGGRVVRLD